MRSQHVDHTRVRDVVAVVLAACGSSQSSKPTASGAELYAANCARCHGADGTGGNVKKIPAGRLDRRCFCHD